jgi:hypothetical protein
MLVDGTPVNGPAALRDVILSQPDTVVTTLTEKLLTYALGRGVEAYDMPAVRKIVRGAAPGGYRFSSLISGIVNSVPFQMAKTDKEPNP